VSFVECAHLFKVRGESGLVSQGFIAVVAFLAASLFQAPTEHLRIVVVICGE
jgi:hypothetical protein